MARYRTGVSATVGGVDTLTDRHYDAVSPTVAAMKAVYNSPLADHFGYVDSPDFSMGSYVAFSVFDNDAILIGRIIVLEV